MQQQLMAFAGEYDAEADKQAHERDGRRSLRHPLVFAFVGDACLEALGAICEQNDSRWDNGRGVVYVHLYTERTLERDRVFGVQLPALSADRKTIRAELAKRFYEDPHKLAECGRAIRRAGSRIAECGSMFESFGQLHIAVVTVADDPCSVLLQETALLLRSALGESFKQIQTDLYALIREKRGDGDYAYTAAATVAFMRELDALQSRSYSFSAPLHVTEDGIRLPVEHANAPLFELVYVLGDKNERGRSVEGGMASNYEVVCSLCLLKNRKLAADRGHVPDVRNNASYGRESYSQEDDDRKGYGGASYSREDDGREGYRRERLGREGYDDGNPSGRSYGASYGSEGSGDRVRAAGAGDADYDNIGHHNVSYKYDNVSYNNESFRRHIASAGVTGNVYATAGFSKVRRPNRAIALTVLERLTAVVIGRLKERSGAERGTMLALWGIDADAIDRMTETLVPDRGQLAAMHALLSADVPFDELRRLTLAEAEEALYGKHADAFFREHFADKTSRMLERLDLDRQVREAAERRILGDPRYGLYCAFDWTSKLNEGAVYRELRAWSKETAKRLEESRLALDHALRESVEAQPFRRVPFLKKSTLRHFSVFFFESVYGRRLDILLLQTRLKLLEGLEAALVRFHGEIRPKVDRLHGLEQAVREASRHSVSEANDYLGRNIPEYYATVVDGIVKELEAERGREVWFEEPYVGNVAALLEDDSEPLLERLIGICRSELFPRGPFRESFEDELIRRANVTVRFDDKDNVLSRERLYRDLTDTLRERAAVRVEVFDYTQKHRYEEHYLFGDGESELIRYALEAEAAAGRGYRLGNVHERRNSGVERLGLMGGFRMEDLLLYRNGKKYYDSYKANGFLFHAKEPNEP